MKPRIVTLSRILLVLYLVGVCVLCFGHFDSLPQIHDKILGIERDKVFHFLMFLPFPLLAYFSLRKEPDGPWKALGEILLLFLAGCIVAAATEIGQGMIPYREADPKDFLADGLALAFSSLVVFILMLVRGIRSGRRP